MDATGLQGYSNLFVLDGSISQQSTTVNGAMAQQLFQFDLIQIIERSQGAAIWQGAATLAQKIVVAKNILTNVLVRWHGYASGPGGNKATVARWPISGVYSAYDLANIFHTNGSITQLQIGSDVSSINSTLQNDGCLYYLTYANYASDGTTASVINTDYVKIDLTFNNPIGGTNKIAI
ncbi:hypothetical protein HPK19_19470 [Arthrobacter citreus]|nr:hypothetical protein HPK19_19470 [Arthrobacter citreus]